MATKSMSTRPIVIAIIVGAIIIGVCLAIGLGVGLSKDDEKECPSVQVNGAEFQSASGTYHYAAVVADSEICSDIGNDVLARLRGNAIDATVAALFCSGVLSPHSCGIGGGSFFTIYHKATNKFYSADSRESAPAAATRDMYVGDQNKRKSLEGGMASGVPGEVLGLYEIHQRFGTVPWKQLVMPTVKLCQDGFPIPRAVARAIASIRTKADFVPYFDNDGTPKGVNSILQLPKLAKTYQAIAEDPFSFYNGSLAADVVSDLGEKGGIITLDDLKEYTVKWSEPTNMSLPGGYQVYSTPPPGSGLVLSYILGILAGYNMDPSNVASDDGKILTYHRMVEAFKFAYGKRSELGDENFHDVTEHAANMTSREFGELTRMRIDDDSTHSTDYYQPSFSTRVDSGTSQLSVIDGEGNAVSVTSTVNTYFGSQVRGNKTGIVFNSEMDDFSTPNTTNYFGLPASPANFIEPGKRPMSSMCPALVWDDNAQRIKMATGAAGGSKITTATAMNIMDVLYLGRTLPQSVDLPRLHHQLIPPNVQVEKTFSQSIQNGLKAKGHTVSNMIGTSVIQAIDVTDNEIVGTADFRKGGIPKGL